MERLRRVNRLWSWLPAFRAVAETQHLPTASAQLYVSPSALSRTIRLLEEDIGHRLFLRSGRRIELNDAGQRFLVAVRNAMRLVHDGLVSLDGAALEGPVWVSSAGLATTAHVLPGLRALRQRHPELLPCLRQDPVGDVAGALLRGELDVGFVTQPSGDPQIAKIHVASSSCGIWCGAGHPLHDASGVTPADLLAHPFVALAPGGDGDSLEGWPPALERSIAMHVSDQALALRVCEAGELLAVLPDVAAGGTAGLRRLPLDLVPATEIFALTRPSLGAGGKAQAVLEAVREALPVTAAPR